MSSTDRDQIKDEIRSFAPKNTGIKYLTDDEIYEIADLIAQKQKEARIDELENRLRVQFIPSHWARLCAEVNSWAKYVDRRIAQLKSELQSPDREEDKRLTL